MKKIIKRFVKGEKGVAQITETLILAGVSIALVVAVFFPSVKTFMEGAVGDLENWYSTKTEAIFN